MYQIDTNAPNTSPTLPPPAAAATPAFFQDGGSPGTVVRAEFLNMVMMELIYLVDGAGLAPSKTNYTQVLEAVQALIQANKLSAPTTFYVSPSGSDSSGNGTSGAPWATVQHAINSIAGAYDLNGQTITIQLADGTYAPFTVVPFAGQVNGPGQVIIQGDVANPANVVITGSTTAITGQIGSQFTLQYLEASCIGGTTASAVVQGITGSFIEIGPGFIMGGNGANGYGFNISGTLTILDSYEISGGGDSHFYIEAGGTIGVADGIVTTLTGAPAFSYAFAHLVAGGIVSYHDGSASFAGSGATGPRYAVAGNSVINTFGGGATYLPGSAGGSFATGGQYI